LGEQAEATLRAQAIDRAVQETPREIERPHGCRCGADEVQGQRVARRVRRHAGDAGNHLGPSLDRIRAGLNREQGGIILRDGESLCRRDYEIAGLLSGISPPATHRYGDERFQRHGRCGLAGHLVGDRGEGRDSLPTGPAVLIERLEPQGQPHPLLAAQRERLRLAELSQREVGAPELELDLGGAQEQASAIGCGIAQLRRPLERRRGGRRRATQQGPVGDVFEISRHLLVALCQRCCLVPHAAIRTRRIRSGQRPVAHLPLRGRGGVVNRSANQGVAKSQRPSVARDESGGFRRSDVIEGDRAVVGQRSRREDLTHTCAAVERGDQKQRAGRERKLGHTPDEGTLEPLGDRQRGGGRPGGVGVGFERARELYQRQRVALSLVEQPAPDLERQPGGGRGQQGVRARAVQRVKPHFGQTGPVEMPNRAVACRQQDDDRLGPHPSRDEGKDIAGGDVEPVSVVDHEQQRGARRPVGEYVECGKSDGEDVRCRPVADTESHRQGHAPALGKGIQLSNQRAQEPVQAGKRHPPLERRPGDAQHRHPDPVRPSPGVLEQGRLADAGLAANQERSTPSADVFEAFADQRQLARASEQPRRLGPRSKLWFMG
jgi:hypothetical protein